MRRWPVITYALYPATFAGALTAAWFARTRDVHPGLVLATITVVTALVIIVAERIQPAFVDWNRARGDVGTDILHAIVSMIALPPLIDVAVRAGMLTLATQVAIGVDIWPTSSPIALQLGLALIVSQFGEYWVHRAMHENAWLWRLHATHHSPDRLYWLNAARFHPLDTATSYTVATAPLVLLGVPGDVLVLMSIWIAVHGLFQHCNVHLRLGPLNYVFSMAELHRWHHSLKLAEANTNYGNNIIFWDIVFGTLFWPKNRDASEAIGLSDLPAFPRGYFGQLASPFRWRQIEAATDQLTNERVESRGSSRAAPTGAASGTKPPST